MVVVAGALLGPVTVRVSGAAGRATVSRPPLALTADVLELNGWEFGDEDDWPMDSWLQGAVCAAPNTCTEVDYPADEGEEGAQQGAKVLAQSLAGTSGKVVYTYSAGGSAATYWLQNDAGKSGQPGPDQVAFVMVADPHSAKGGAVTALGLGSATPVNSGYTVIQVAQEYDGVADYPTNTWNWLADANAIAGYLQLHPDYSNVDLYSPDNLVAESGATTYVLTPTQDLPLLQPLRSIGLTQLADALNGPLKAYIDTAYNRTGYAPMTPADVTHIQSVIGGSVGATSPAAKTMMAVANSVPEPSSAVTPVVAATAKADTGPARPTAMPAHTPTHTGPGARLLKNVAAGGQPKAAEVRSKDHTAKHSKST